MTVVLLIGGLLVMILVGKRLRVVASLKQSVGNGTASASLLSGNFVDGAGQVTGREWEKGLFGCYRLELGFGRLGLFGLGDSQCTSANLFSRN